MAASREADFAPVVRRSLMLTSRSVTVYLEFASAILILVAIFNFIRFFYYQGYLPFPFFDDVSDTFMDWYNTVYWGYRRGTYDEWLSVYPPFTFIFMRMFSVVSCYSESSQVGRACDPFGAWVITVCTVINAILIFLNYRMVDRRTALPRAIAVGLGASALFGWERGNVIVCCFTFFILAHGRLLRSTWLRWVCFGITANLKPYLVVTVLGRLLRRKWRWAEGCAISCILVYSASYMALGRGNPFELLSNILFFSGTPDKVTIDYLDYATTYNSVLDIMKTQLPLMFYLGSRLIEVVEFWAPVLIRLADVGVIICFAGVIWRPNRLHSHRLVALTMVMLLTTTKTLGSYAEVFMLFLVYLERWDGVGQSIALTAAYLLSVPWDVLLIRIVHIETDAWLSGRRVSFDSGLTLGGMVRPGLLLAIQFGLVFASFRDLVSAPRRSGSDRAAWTPHPPLTGALPP